MRLVVCEKKDGNWNQPWLEPTLGAWGSLYYAGDADRKMSLLA